MRPHSRDLFKRSKLNSPRFLVLLLRDRARRHGERTAFVFLADGETESGRRSYAELDRSARAIGQRLAGERVLLVYSPGLA
jgi:acyl-CoA synthetase (AMP-forming)/AMP-acid ligase II